MCKCLMVLLSVSNGELRNWELATVIFVDHKNITGDVELAAYVMIVYCCIPGQEPIVFVAS